jgi:hypothetical protein
MVPCKNFKRGAHVFGAVISRGHGFGPAQNNNVACSLRCVVMEVALQGVLEP